MSVVVAMQMMDGSGSGGGRRFGWILTGRAFVTLPIRSSQDITNRRFSVTRNVLIGKFKVLATSHGSSSRCNIHNERRQNKT